MKELSIEEKAKAYDKAIERAKDFMNGEAHYELEIGENIMCWIFPELRESEDERIMEKVISTIHLYYGEPLEDEAKEMIAWLEKQKVLTTEEDLQGKEDVLWCIKQAKKHAKDENEMGTCWFAEKWLEKQGEKPIDKIQIGKQYKCIASPRYSTFMRGEIYKPEDKFLCSLMNFCSDCFEPIEDGEQKPVNRLKITAGNWYVCEIEVMNENMITAFHRGEVYYCPKDGYIDVNGMLFEVGDLDVFRLATKEEIPQPKSDWSKEDEKIIIQIKKALEDFFPTSETDKIKYWLNSLKDRVGCEVNCTTTKEWSEEDEVMFRKAIITIDNVRMDTNSQEYYQGICNWLKSLKERYTWKPSEEQMLAINTAINVLGKGTLNGKQLIELYQDLKKLK